MLSRLLDVAGGWEQGPCHRLSWSVRPLGIFNLPAGDLETHYFFGNRWRWTAWIQIHRWHPPHYPNVSVDFVLFHRGAKRFQEIQVEIYFRFLPRRSYQIKISNPKWPTISHQNSRLRALFTLFPETARPHNSTASTLATNSRKHDRYQEEVTREEKGSE